MPDKNPFRRQEGLPPPSPDPPLPPLPSSSSSQPDMPPSSSHPAPLDLPEDDLPPPYTPSASLGEETVGLGPRRPFQHAPPPPQPPLHPQPNWLSPPAQTRQPVPTGPGYRSPGPAPWQSQHQYRQRPLGGGGLLGILFDTVRDIADAVSGANDERTMAAQRANAGAYAAPYSGTGSTYAPPSGPPVHRSPPPPPRPASTPPRTPSSRVPDDGTPTRTPVPGHPLLRDGHLLVYPRDHLCVKCKNTGYKNYDPSHPCRKCWEKYGKPYTGALSYTPWSSSGNDPRMQRPLPKFVPPHLSSSGTLRDSSSRALYPPPQHPQHSRSVSQPHYSSNGTGPSYYVMDPLSLNPTPPVPHAIPVNPGDSRLGGRLCMRCHGAGTRTILLIDVMTCEYCGGTGRVWM